MGKTKAKTEARLDKRNCQITHISRHWVRNADLRVTYGAKLDHGMSEDVMQGVNACAF